MKNSDIKTKKLVIEIIHAMFFDIKYLVRHMINEGRRDINLSILFKIKESFSSFIIEEKIMKEEKLVVKVKANLEILSVILTELLNSLKFEKEFFINLKIEKFQKVIEELDGPLEFTLTGGAAKEFLNFKEKNPR